MSRGKFFPFYSVKDLETLWEYCRLHIDETQTWNHEAGQFLKWLKENPEKAQEILEKR